MDVSIGFIGVGNMGSAIVRGLSGMQGLSIYGYDLYKPGLEKLAEECGLVPATDVKELVKACDYVLLAVKPQQLEEAVRDMAPFLDESKCLISIAAGVTSQAIKEFSGSKCPVVRVMPNTPALVKEGVFAVCLDDTMLGEDQKKFVGSMFEPVGQVHVLGEKYFDAFTALAGSGPAYVFYFMDALVEAGVNVGLTRPQSTEIVTALLSGSVKLAQESPLHLCQLREMVTSPAGTTIKATNHFDRTGLRASVIDAVFESYLRSKELG